MIDVLLIAPQNKKIIFQHLIDLVALEPPTYMLLVAQYLRNKKLTVQVIDGQFYTAKEIASLTEYLDPILVGVYVYGNQPSASTQCMSAARETCQAIKNLNPSRNIMISGTHPAALPKKTLIEEPVDFVCDREGFETAYQLVQNLKSSNSFKAQDIWFKTDVNGHEIVDFSFRGKLLTQDEMNLIQMPAWDLVERNGKLDHYRSHNWHAFNTNSEKSPYASIYTSFGCPYSCNFCCINAPFGEMNNNSPRPYRLFSPEIIVSQIEILAKKYEIKNIKFVDEMFVLNPKHVFGITNGLIEKGLGELINIWAYARVDTAKPKFLEPLKKAGFNWLCLGIECGNRNVRKIANKMELGHDDIVNVCERISSAGINIIGNYIFGLPDDSLERMQETFDLACELNCEFANFYVSQPYPGSPLYYDNKNNASADWKSYSQHSYETLPLPNKYCSSVEILKFRDEAHLRYFLREEYQKMVWLKFGQRALDDIKQMLSFGSPQRKVQVCN